jgi:hypothetical protein
VFSTVSAINQSTRELAISVSTIAGKGDPCNPFRAPFHYPSSQLLPVPRILALAAHCRSEAARHTRLRVLNAMS